MNDTEYILGQLQLYYDCRLTDAEEARLRTLVACSRSDRPEIEEARALMGFRRPQRRSRRRVFATVAAAASLLVMLAVGGWLMHDSRTAPGASYAYCGGVYINNENEVLDILAQNLSEFGGDIDDADRSMECELNEFAEFISENLNEQ